MRNWEKSGEEIWEDFETSDGRDMRKRGRRCVEVKAELGGSGGELWEKNLQGKERRALTGKGKSWKKVREGF